MEPLFCDVQVFYVGNIWKWYDYLTIFFRIFESWIDRFVYCVRTFVWIVSWEKISFCYWYLEHCIIAWNIFCGNVVSKCEYFSCGYEYIPLISLWTLGSTAKYSRGWTDSRNLTCRYENKRNGKYSIYYLHHRGNDSWWKNCRNGTYSRSMDYCWNSWSMSVCGKFISYKKPSTNRNSSRKDWNI